MFNAGLIQCNLTEPLSPNEVATIDIVVEPEVPGVTLQNTAGVFFDNLANPDFPTSLVDADTEPTVVDDNGGGDGGGGGGGDDFFDDDDGIPNGIDEDFEESDLEEAENDLEELENEMSTLEDEATTADDFDDDGESGVSASSGEEGAEASTPGASASSGGDPDEQAPVAGPQGDVQDEVATEGPLPETGGASVAAGTSLALVLFGLSLLALRLVSGWCGRRT